jgi:hypothetical protein
MISFSPINAGGDFLIMAIARNHRGDSMISSENTRRREFIAGISAAAWPLPARAQRERVRRIGLLGSAPFESLRGILTPAHLRRVLLGIGLTFS